MVRLIQEQIVIVLSLSIVVNKDTNSSGSAAINKQCTYYINGFFVQCDDEDFNIRQIYKHTII